MIRSFLNGIVFGLATLRALGAITFLVALAI